MSLADAWAQFAGFGWPWALFALPLPWVLRWLLPPARRSGPALRVPWAARLARVAAVPGRRGGSAGGMPWLGWLAWALVCLAAARPFAWGDAVQPPQAARELMLAVDLSASMGERDMWMGRQLVERLTAARAVIGDFLERRQGDRVGLLVFGRSAHVLAPPTADLETVRGQLLATEVSMVGRETAIGDAIGLGVKRLQAQREGDRVLVLLTDGVNTAGVLDPLRAAEIARDEGVRIHTIAFGGEGEQLSVLGFRLPSGGSTIDEDALAEIAAMTGGRSFRARDVEALAGIYAEIDRIEPVEAPGEALRPRLERYHWPLGLALLVALLAAAASLRRDAR